MSRAALPAQPPWADWWSAVPGGRVGYQLSAPVLLLHSFQSAAAYQSLRCEGVLRGVVSTVEVPEFLDAYRWMSRQLDERGFGGGELADPDRVPVWVWARTTRRALADRARWAARHEPGCVLLTLRVPAERVLLSRFMEWHIVLGGSPLWPSDTPDDGFDAFDAQWEARWGVDWRKRLAAGYDPALRAAVERSWDAVFEVSSCKASEPIQACLTDLFADDVIQVVEIRPAKRRRPNLPI